MTKSRFSKLVFLPLMVLGLLLSTTTVKAEAVCSGWFNLDFQTSQSNFDEWNKGFRYFFENAKENNLPSILESFSEVDGSRGFIADQLSKFDKFGNYKNTELKNVELPALVWSDYWIRDVVYVYAGREVSLPDAMVCDDGSCQMSAILENGSDDSEFLIGLHRLAKGAKTEGSCSSKGAQVEIPILPASKTSDSNPVRLKIGEGNLKAKESLKLLDDFFARCSIQEDEKVSADLQNAKCFKGDTSTFVHAFELGQQGGGSLLLYSFPALINSILRPESIKAVFPFEFEDRKDVFVLFQDAQDKKYASVLSFSSQAKLDLTVVSNFENKLLLRPEVVWTLTGLAGEDNE